VKWGRVIAVFLVVVMICGLFVRVPLARATDPGYFQATFMMQTGSTGQSRGTLRVSLVDGSGNSIKIATTTGAWSVSFAGSVNHSADVKSADSYYLSYAYCDYYKSAWVTGTSLGTWTCTYSVETTWGVASGTLSLTTTAWNSTKNVVSSRTVWAALPPSVVLSGASSASLGQNYTYSAAISGGTAPYSVVFERSSTAHPADDLTYATQSGSGQSYSQVVQFPSIDASYIVAVTVTDATNATATDSITVNASSDKPVVYGAAKLGANGQVEFRATLTPPAGVFPNDSTSLPTSGEAPTMWYTVLTPSWLLRSAYHFILSASSPVANPYVVMISLMDRAGVEWTYVFSFDTSTWSAPGDWSDSTGGTGSDAEIPTWLQSLLNSLRNLLLKLWETILAALKAMFQWLFVPTDAQMTSLLPSGTMGATLLEGLPAFTGADTSPYTLHTHWTVGGVSKQIDLLTIDLSTLASSGFVSVMKLVIQAGMSLGLIFMVVALI